MGKPRNVNPEMIHKAMLLRISVKEISTHLHWRTPATEPEPPKRTASMKLMRHT
ncbi:hypothetical protein [Myxacorys almedinensis]|uniref:hypothetical protein n=1 Tax=Myxacorys almedinensis TaxID=2651157 RepID=UPI0013907B31|nr:hypothetical protein [Myxacorys almedinensis]